MLKTIKKALAYKIITKAFCNKGNIAVKKPNFFFNIPTKNS
jgi:hypothetical protein